MANDKKQTIELGITRLEHGGNRQQRAVLELETEKGTRGLRCSATVFWHSAGSRVHMFGTAGGGDFNKTLATSPARATQKAIDTLHAATFTLERIEELVREAKAHYAGYVSAGKDGFDNVYQAAA